jgi:hypothetical protein
VTPTDSDELERMLSTSAPRTTTVNEALEDELARMSVRARIDHAPATRRRVAGRVAAGAIAVAVVLGGAGAAAAATGGWWSSWWANEPDAVVHYALPSGAQCEYRMGGLMVRTADEPVRLAAREWFATADLDAIIARGIDARVDRVRADDVLIDGPDGTLISAEVDPRTEDSVYTRAVGELVHEAMTDALTAQGFDMEWAPGENGLTIAGELNCPGAQW